MRADGRPHVTPLIGVYHDGAVHFCTGVGRAEGAQPRARAARSPLTTGANTWAEGLDIVVEGEAVRVTDNARAAGARRRHTRPSTASVWHFDVGDGAFGGQGEDPGYVFRVEPAKVLAFAKEPHAQTSYRFG